MNILIIDDDAQLRLALKHVLRREGHEVSEAEDGETGLRALSAARFDLLLLDMIMPRREGLETLLEIRKDWPEIKIIAMSGGARFSRIDPLQAAQHCGADFIIEKPFPPDDLRALLRQC